MTDYAVLGKQGRWSVLREGREIAAYPTQDQAVDVARKLRIALVGPRVDGQGQAPQERRGFGLGRKR